MKILILTIIVLCLLFVISYAVHQSLGTVDSADRRASQDQVNVWSFTMSGSGGQTIDSMALLMNNADDGGNDLAYFCIYTTTAGHAGTLVGVSRDSAVLNSSTSSYQQLYMQAPGGGALSLNGGSIYWAGWASRTALPTAYYSLGRCDGTNTGTLSQFTDAWPLETVAPSPSVHSPQAQIVGYLVLTGGVTPGVPSRKKLILR